MSLVVTMKKYLHFSEKEVFEMPLSRILRYTKAV
nr:MAG TPA: hypothetical protein [Caudoviricetes sp.]DAK77880.1 MAG TPA: hypothetical protein [Caudoviricetes sp.]